MARTINGVMTSSGAIQRVREVITTNKETIKTGNLGDDSEQGNDKGNFEEAVVNMHDNAEGSQNERLCG